MPLKLGDILDKRYRIDALLGTGGMGAVYRAWHVGIEQPCAVKEFLLGHLPSESDTRVHEPDELRKDKAWPMTREKAIEQFKREAELLAQLDHPNLPKVTDYFEAGDGYYLVMTLIEGQNLARLPEFDAGRPVPEKQVLAWMEQVMDALEYCHTQGIIHHDVKPDNIIITSSGQVYLVDFGIAKIYNPDAKTTIGARLVAPGYSPPEQYSGQGLTDARSDIYSLGATMYALLTGLKPVEAIERTTGDDETASPRSVVSDISPGVDAAVRRAMEIKPADRFQSIADMKAALMGEYRLACLFDDGLAAYRRGAWAEACKLLEQVVQQQPLYARGKLQARQLLQEAEQHLRKPSRKPKRPKISPAATTVLLTPLARLGKGTLEKIAWSPEGKTLIVAGSAGVYSYAADTLAEAQFIDVGAWVTDIALSPDGRMLATSSKDNAVRLWYTAGGQLLHTMEEQPGDAILAFSSDGRVLASAHQDVVRLWDISALLPGLSTSTGPAGAGSGRLLGALEGQTGDVLSMAFDPIHPILALGSEDNTVWLWAISSGQLRALKGHGGDVASVAFGPDGRMLASGSQDKTIRLWDVTTGQLLHTLKRHKGSVTSLAFSSDGRTLASGSDNRQDNIVRVWDAASGQMLHEIKEHKSGVLGLAFSPDGRTLALASEAHVLWLWNTDSGQLLRTLRDHTAGVTCVAFSPDGRMLLSGSLQGARLWDVGSGQLLRTFAEQAAVNSAALSPDGRTLALALYEGVELRDVASGQLLRTLRKDTHAWVDTLTFSPDGRTLASSEDKTIHLWSIRSGRRLRALEGHASDINSLAFSPDGSILASGSCDNTVRLWKTSNSQLLRTLKGHTEDVCSVAFSPDGSRLASSGCDGTARLWDAASGQLLRTIETRSNVPGVAFSPDGCVLALGCEDSTVQLWDASTGQRLHILTGHTASVKSVAFGSDGRTLASGSEDGTVRVWKMG